VPRDDSACRGSRHPVRPTNVADHVTESTGTIIKPIPYISARRVACIRALLPVIAAFIVYLVLSVSLFGSSHGLSRAYIGVGTDPLSFIWALNWWPWSLAHGINPFVTRFIWYPTDVNLTWVTSVPAAAFLALPVTLLWGAVASWNVLALLAPPLGALSAFLLTRYLTRSFVASLVGGYVFGFSTYEIAHLLGHMNLYLTFVPPLLVLAALARRRGEWTGKRFVITTTLLLLLQVGLSTEIFATVFVFGGATWLVFLLFAKAQDRAALWRLAWEIGLATALVAVFGAPFFYYVVVGAQLLPEVINSPQTYSVDLLNFLVPTPITRLGQTVFSDMAGRFPGNFSESSGYLGLPLIVALGASFRNADRHRLPLGILILLFAVCSLGPSLWINGVQTGVWLPWRIALNVPIIRHALPGRFTMFVFLATAVAIAAWLAGRGSVPAKLSRYALAGIGCLFLLPNRIPWTPLPSVPFFTPQQIARAFPAGENVIVLPFGETGPGMLWQLESGMYFTQTGGYFGTPPTTFAPDTETMQALLSGNPLGNFANNISAFAAVHQVSEVLAGPGTPTALLAGLNALHWQARDMGDVRIFHVPEGRNLHYVDVRGDYWGTTSEWNWMGRRVAIVTHNQAVRLLVKGYRINGAEKVRLRISTNETVADYIIDPLAVLSVDLPTNAKVSVEAGPTFVPDEIMRNGDKRVLSVLMFLQPQ
jgi:hypothetical protein